MYQRKTIDTWEIHVNYGQGWEHEVTEFTRKDAIHQKKDYNANCDYPVKIVYKRVKKTESEVGE